MKWSIPTDKLTDPRRGGGRENIKGIAFQDAYICLQLITLLDEEKGIIAVRPEGAQDVDLLYSDGREEYIQLKKSPHVIFIKEILPDFAETQEIYWMLI